MLPNILKYEIIFNRIIIKMKFNLLLKLILLISLTQSCKPQTESFDLFGFDFSETIENILTQHNLELLDGKSEALTLFGFERFETTTPKLLVFDGISLSNKKKGIENNIIFHFSTNNNLIAMYEVNLYTENEVKNISETLNSKIGAPHYSSKANEDVDLKIWTNEKLKVYYFLMTYENEENNMQKTEFTVIDMNNKRAKEWVDFRNFNYFLD